MMSASIVIPVYNGRKTIALAIDSALAQDYTPKPEIIVIDDGSTDDTPEICLRYPDIKFIPKSNGGPSSARNAGWRAAAGEVVFFMDSDCVAPQTWVSSLMRHHEEEGIGCTGAIYGIANPQYLLARVIYYEFLRRYEFCGKYTSFIGSYGYSFRRTVLEEVGGYDETYLDASHEDNDLGWRIIQNGYRLLLDKNCAMKHHFPTSLSSYLRIQRKHGYWRMKLIRNFPGSAKGDDYSNVFDYIQPPLYLLALILLVPWLLFWQWIFLLCSLALLFTAAFAQAPVLSGLRTKGASRLELVYYSMILSPLRSIMRSLGMVAGIYIFWISSKRN